MKFDEWHKGLKEKQDAVNTKQLEHEGAKQELHRYLLETVGLDLGGPVGIDSVAALSAKVFDMKSEK